VAGLTHISARTYIRQQLGDNLMTFAVPLTLYREMEANVSASFLERPVWQKLAAGKGGKRGTDDGDRRHCEGGGEVWATASV
jgi:hypothetical protein